MLILQMGMAVKADAVIITEMVMRSLEEADGVVL
jgi:hypothetical protein